MRGPGFAEILRQDPLSRLKGVPQGLPRKPLKSPFRERGPRGLERRSQAPGRVRAPALKPFGRSVLNLDHAEEARKAHQGLDDPSPGLLLGQAVVYSPMRLKL